MDRSSVAAAAIMVMARAAAPHPLQVRRDRQRHGGAQHRRLPGQAGRSHPGAREGCLVGALLFTHWAHAQQPAAIRTSGRQGASPPGCLLAFATCLPQPPCPDLPCRPRSGWWRCRTAASAARCGTTCCRHAGGRRWKQQWQSSCAPCIQTRRHASSHSCLPTEWCCAV